MNLTPRSSPGASVTPLARGWRLSLPAGDSKAYRLAQLDDYAHLARRNFSSRPPLTMNLRARVSGASLPGTWGFGLWNDPFGLSLGFGGNPFRLPCFPNAIWFFHASQENWLSFNSTPGNGFLAQSFRSPKIPSPLLALSGIFALPILATRFTRIFLRKLAGFFIRGDSVRLEVDQSQWHSYRLVWSLNRVICEVDEARVFESNVSPRPPLGYVIWIDNQFAAFTPDGKIGYGVLSNESAWLEVEGLSVRSA